MESANVVGPAPVTALMERLKSGIRVGVPGDLASDPIAPSVDDGLGWLQHGRYKGERLVAEGGMGQVYRVYDQELERHVALKVLRPEVAADPLFVASFIEEARAIGQMDHSCIMPVYDLGMSATNDIYFTMKYIQGETLEGLIKRLRAGDQDAHTEYPFNTRLRLVVDLAEALAYAHARGVMHRDVKPGNVMVGPFGQVTLMDWGLARRNEAGPHSVGETQISRLGTGASLSGVAAGTPGYVAPEVLLDGSKYSPRCDVYSLGVLMYELFTLQSPYPDASEAELLTRPLQVDPLQADAVLNTVQGRVPKEIALIIAKAMSRDPEQRYNVPHAVVYAIQQYQSGAAPVVCVHTGLKRAVYSFAKLVDEHGHLVIVILTILLASPFVLALLWWLARYL